MLSKSGLFIRPDAIEILVRVRRRLNLLRFVKKTSDFWNFLQKLQKLTFCPSKEVVRVEWSSKKVSSSKIVSSISELSSSSSASACRLSQWGPVELRVAQCLQTSDAAVGGKAIAIPAAVQPVYPQTRKHVTYKDNCVRAMRQRMCVYSIAQ